VLNYNKLFLLSVFKNIPGALLFYDRSSTNDSRTSKLWNRNLCFCFSFEGRHWEGSRKFANGINQFAVWYWPEPKVFWNKIARFLFLLAKINTSSTQVFWVKNDCNVRQLVCVWQFVPLVNNNKTKSRSGLTDGHMKSVMTVVSSNNIPGIKILSPSKRCQVSSQSTR
jgi:hypothetical protein